MHWLPFDAISQRARLQPDRHSVAPAFATTSSEAASLETADGGESTVCPLGLGSASPAAMQYAGGWGTSQWACLTDWGTLQSGCHDGPSQSGIQTPG